MNKCGENLYGVNIHEGLRNVGWRNSINAQGALGSKHRGLCSQAPYCGCGAQVWRLNLFIENKQTKNLSKTKFIDTNRLVVPRGRGWMVGETEEGGEKVQLPVDKVWGQEKPLDFPSHLFRAPQSSVSELKSFSSQLPTCLKAYLLIFEWLHSEGQRRRGKVEKAIGSEVLIGFFSLLLN